MSERITPAEQVYVEYLCDECGEPMKFEHSPGVKFWHICPNDHMKLLEKFYPRFESRRVTR